MILYAAMSSWNIQSNSVKDNEEVIIFNNCALLGILCDFRMMFPKLDVFKLPGIVLKMHILI